MKGLNRDLTPEEEYERLSDALDNAGDSENREYSNVFLLDGDYRIKSRVFEAWEESDSPERTAQIQYIKNPEGTNELVIQDEGGELEMGVGNLSSIDGAKLGVAGTYAIDSELYERAGFGYDPEKMFKEVGQPRNIVEIDFKEEDSWAEESVTEEFIQNLNELDKNDWGSRLLFEEEGPVEYETDQPAEDQPLEDLNLSEMSNAEFLEKAGELGLVFHTFGVLPEEFHDSDLPDYTPRRQREPSTARDRRDNRKKADTSKEKGSSLTDKAEDAADVADAVDALTDFL